MDKYNYTPTLEKIQEIKKVYEENKEKILKEVEKRKVIIRKRIIKSYEQLFEAAFRRLIHSLSYRRLALEMSTVFNVSLSNTAWKKQLKKFIPILYEVISKFMNPLSQKNGTYLVDATEIPVEGGKGYSARLHTCYCLANQMIDQIVIGDWHIAETVCNFLEIHSNSLYIGDRAYGKAKQISYIIENNANCLFRISPSLIMVYEDPECKNKIDFKALLKGKKTINKVCYISCFKKIYKIRIVAKLIPEEKRSDAEKRCKRKSSKAQKKFLKRPFTLVNG